MLKKAWLPISVTDLGICNTLIVPAEPNAVQPLKALSPIFCSVLGKIKSSDNPVQPSNAESPIVLTLLPN